ncbi:bifunctional cytochrome P450/NADPH--P450 reductase [Paenibacillus apiarius]|uniref:bifunctional cytochrome P450/NADPH--P450 reductase n=1 Tax=Paenibacillus apiarius TaxID=46240 RepID=UPI00197F74C9|nr:bifunctional cytochrome P450/NADPH--P450 reductase [Paenibacillus apiarius]MBN3522619.1 bifunctional cytochrome P450/NADPH--P450 reductase [Paenibacillus apiarius]
MTITIPQPKTFGPLGNLPQINLEAPVQSLVKLAEEYGTIFRMDLPGRSEIFISGHELVEDACDESRFDKKVWAPLQKVRAFTKDGLFTAETEEPNWQKAHHILLPSFSQTAMRGYHEMMVDLAVQLIQKWGRLNPDESVNVPEDMTRLTLDTIGLCGFNYRFNSFYREQQHPFITSMVRALDEAMSQLQRLGIQDKLMVITKRQFMHDMQAMFSLVDRIIAERKAHGDQGGNDLLAHMLNGKDPETGEALDDENIRYQIITFLIAGHETTSGLLSFALYFLLKNPDKLHKAYEEVDRVLTEPVPSYTEVRNLKYIRMILSESLRLWPTAPAFALYAKEDTLLAGKYPLKQGESVNVLIPKLHRDTEVWGEDVEEFRPERFEDPSRIPHHAYKPFGNGQRACIGQQFALQEATLVLGMVLKHFEIIDHSQYQLKVKETLTLKPDGFTMRVRPRGGQVGYAIAGAAETHAPEQKAAEQASPNPVEAHNTPLLVLYGSNLGTAEGIAREMADSARYQGFRSEVAPLNEYVGKLPKQGAVYIVSASYNGKPPSNAHKFVQWLQEVEPGELEGVRYAVFGCGDHNWASTYQEVPRFIDDQLASKGATRLASRGEGDASGDFEMQVESWREHLWPDVMTALGLKINEKTERESGTLTVQYVSGFIGTPLAETYDATYAKVAENRELQAEGSERSTRHIEIALPEGISYKEGDHVGVLPRNRKELIERVLRRFGMDGNDHVVLNATGRSAAHLPLERPVSLHDLLSHSVELQEAATRAQLRELAAFTVCPPHKRELDSLLEEDAYKANVLQKRLTMLDLLEKYEACELPFERFLELLPPLKARYYSISSSPRAQPGQASITVAVVRGPAWSGQGEYRGVASNYLAGQHPGDAIVMFVRTPESGFELPENPEVPIIMVGPGTGVAPFRGFLQARRALKEEGKALGEAHLYFGCRNEADEIYRVELERFEHEGLVRVHTAFSRKEGQPKTYVQHLMQQHAQEIIGILDRDGRLYVCGDGSKMAPDVEATLQQAYQDIHQASEAEAKQWMERLQTEGLYAKDVWAGI